MVLRFLFCLTSSLLSGSAVAVLFTALMQHTFPDVADNPLPPLVNWAANQRERSVAVRPQPEPATEPTHAEAQPTPLSRSAPGPRVLEAANDPAVHQNPFPALQSSAQAATQQRYPEFIILTQEAAVDRGQLLAAPGALPILAGRLPAVEATEAAPDPPPQQDQLASVAQPTADQPMQQKDSVGGSVTQWNARDQGPTIAASVVAADAHARATTGGHATRGRLMTRASHADHVHRRAANRSVDHHAHSQQAQRQTQE